MNKLLFVQAFDFPRSAQSTEDLFILLGGIVVGIIIAHVILTWVTRRTYFDKRMPAVKVMRIRRGEKKVYVANPRDVGEFLHTVFIVLLWESGLKRGATCIYYSNGGTSAAIKWAGAAFAFLIIALLVYFCAVDVADPPVQQMDFFSTENPYM